MMQQERRLCSRNTLNPLPHITLPSDNGGIVLDVSEQGLRFRALAPVEESGPIQFSFSAHSNLITGVAELVWTDLTKKIGGLRFTELSDDAREQIRKWPNESAWRLSIGSDLTLHISAVDEISPRMSIRRAFEAILRLKSVWTNKFASISRGRQHTEPKDGTAELHARASESLFDGRRSGLFLTISATTMVIAFSVLSYMHHRKTGEWLVWRGTRTTGVSNQQTVAQSPALNLPVQTLRDGDAFAYKSKVGEPQNLAVTLSTSAASPEAAKKEVAAKLPVPPTLEGDERLRKSAPAGRALFVQIAALTHEADARKLADNLQHENFQAFVRTLPVDALYRVMLGPYENVESAQIAIGKLKKAGFNSFIRRESVPE